MLNRRAAEIARAAAGDRRLVAGAVGPLGIRIEPYGPTSRDEARAMFREQMQALADGGADCFVIETFADLDEMEQAILAARDVDPAMPVIAQMTIGVDGRTPYGVPPHEVARALDRFGADVIGLNCSVGPQTILDAIERMVPETRRKLSAQPNAGMPREVGGRSMYMASPEYMATYARHLVQAGAKIVGGCCGTTPEHIHAMAAGVRPLAPRHRGVPDSDGAGDASTHATVLQSAGGGRLSRVHARVTAQSRGRRGRWCVRRTGRRRARRVRRALAVGGEARRGRVRDVGGDRPAARRGRCSDGARSDRP